MHITKSPQQSNNYNTKSEITFKSVEQRVLTSHLHMTSWKCKPKRGFRFENLNDLIHRVKNKYIDFYEDLRDIDYTTEGSSALALDIGKKHINISTQKQDPNITEVVYLEKKRDKVIKAITWLFNPGENKVTVKKGVNSPNSEDYYVKPSWKQSFDNWCAKRKIHNTTTSSNQ